MHGAIPTVEREARKVARTSLPKAGRDYASEEIYAYVAARDSLLVEAEEKPTAAALRRVRLANEFVVSCLQPAGVPYGNQCLSEADALHEMQRCHDACARIAKLSKG